MNCGFKSRNLDQPLKVMPAIGELLKVFQFKAPLQRGDYENRACSYLPDGKEYKPDPNEKVYLPGKGAPQWTLTRDIEAKCIARLRPGQKFNSSTLG